MKRILTAIALFLFISCAPYKQINLSAISIGMTKEQVVSALKKKPDNLIGAKKYATGNVEVLQYTRYNSITGQLEERYWLYFLDNKLQQWGRPGDWEKEADKIYEYRIR